MKIEGRDNLLDMNRSNNKSLLFFRRLLADVFCFSENDIRVDVETEVSALDLPLKGHLLSNSTSLFILATHHRPS